MVSACSLYLDDIDLAGQKASVPDFLSALFQESDRIEHRDEDGQRSVIYRASRVSVLKRLSLMGCTHELSRRRFAEWKQEQIASLLANEDVNDDADGEQNNDPDSDPGAEAEEFSEEFSAINALTWDEWRRRVPQAIGRMYSLGQAVDYIDGRLREMDYSLSWLWFDGHDSLISLRAILDACDQATTVTLNVTALIGGGWIDVNERVCADKIRVAARRGQPVGPTILLAEGKTDITVLKASIGRFHPDLVEFVTFLDHTEFRVDGGASFVVKFLKAFAAARIPANVVAIFDNDTAGLAAYREARTLRLPPNMTCVHLPDINLARSYPTIGPQGFHLSDVNGTAAGLELYLGQSILSSGGELRPVRWTGFDKNAGAYQGEVDEKAAIQDAFLAAIRDPGTEVDTQFPELKLVWQSILDAAATVAEASQNLARIPRGW